MNETFDEWAARLKLSREKAIAECTDPDSKILLESVHVMASHLEEISKRLQTELGVTWQSTQ